MIEIGTGLNTRFESVDNGVVRWLDLDLPDTIELRRQFFANTDVATHRRNERSVAWTATTTRLTHIVRLNFAGFPGSEAPEK